MQGTILRALRKIARYQDCTISGTSRTDAGVHAQGQIGKVSLPTDLAPETLLQGLNSMLPGSIRVLECERCPQSFNPKAGSSSKEYHYYFSKEPVANPLVSDVVAHVPGPLNLASLEAATQAFMGEHDFYGFCRRSSNAATTVRTIHEFELVRPVPGVLTSDIYALRVVGNGFLKQMIRYMVSALFEVARGNIDLETIAEHLRSHADEKLAPKAPAHGLHLVNISGL